MRTDFKFPDLNFPLWYFHRSLILKKSLAEGGSSEPLNSKCSVHQSIIISILKHVALRCWKLSGSAEPRFTPPPPPPPPY